MLEFPAAKERRIKHAYYMLFILYRIFYKKWNSWEIYCPGQHNCSSQIDDIIQFNFSDAPGLFRVLSGRQMYWVCSRQCTTGCEEIHLK